MCYVKKQDAEQWVCYAIIYVKEKKKYLYKFAWKNIKYLWKDNRRN